MTKRIESEEELINRWINQNMPDIREMLRQQRKIEKKTQDSNLSFWKPFIARSPSGGQYLKKRQLISQIKNDFEMYQDNKPGLTLNKFLSSSYELGNTGTIFRTHYFLSRSEMYAQAMLDNIAKKDPKAWAVITERYGMIKPKDLKYDKDKDTFTYIGKGRYKGETLTLGKEPYKDADGEKNPHYKKPYVVIKRADGEKIYTTRSDDLKKLEQALEDLASLWDHGDETESDILDSIF